MTQSEQEYWDKNNNESANVAYAVANGYLDQKDALQAGAKGKLVAVEPMSSGGGVASDEVAQATADLNLAAKQGDTVEVAKKILAQGAEVPTEKVKGE